MTLVVRLAMPKTRRQSNKLAQQNHPTPPATRDGLFQPLPLVGSVLRLPSLVSTSENATPPPRASDIYCLSDELLTLVFQQVYEDRYASTRPSTPPIEEIMINKRIFGLVKPLWFSRLSADKAQLDSRLCGLLNDQIILETLCRIELVLSNFLAHLVALTLSRLSSLTSISLTVDEGINDTTLQVVGEGLEKAFKIVKAEIRFVGCSEEDRRGEIANWFVRSLGPAHTSTSVFIDGEESLSVTKHPDGLESWKYGSTSLNEINDRLWSKFFSLQIECSDNFVDLVWIIKKSLESFTEDEIHHYYDSISTAITAPGPRILHKSRLKLIKMNESATTCYACGKASNTRCSRCKEAIFCSRSCQELLFPIHKYICSKKDPSTFYFQPLKQDEAEFLRRSLRRTEMKGSFAIFDPDASGMSFIEYINHLGWYRGDLDGLLDVITTGRPNLLPEPRLSLVSILARFHLYAPFRDGPVRQPDSVNEIILREFGLGLGDILTAIPASERFVDRPDDPRQPMKLLNTFCRAALYSIATEVLAVDGRGSKPVLSQWQARMKAVDTSKLEGTVAMFIGLSQELGEISTPSFSPYPARRIWVDLLKDVVGHGKSSSDSCGHLAHEDDNSFEDFVSFLGDFEHYAHYNSSEAATR
ncbi:hypothetical protein JCM3765_000054 [Sporobolomyces pararoseus]